MNKSTTTSPSRASSKPTKSRSGRNGRRSTLGKKTSAEANRRAAVILEVLAGERLPSEAAQLLGVSVTHYYILERKALEGLLAVCQPKPKGPPGPTPEKRVAQLERELARAKRECQRQAALVRSTQRALGLPASESASKPASRKKKAGKTGAKGDGDARKQRRRRRPTVRALRAAETLEKNSSLADSPNAVKEPLVKDSQAATEQAQEER